MIKGQVFSEQQWWRDAEASMRTFSRYSEAPRCNIATFAPKQKHTSNSNSCYEAHLLELWAQALSLFVLTVLQILFSILSFRFTSRLPGFSRSLVGDWKVPSSLPPKQLFSKTKLSWPQRSVIRYETSSLFLDGRNTLNVVAVIKIVTVRRFIFNYEYNLL